MKTLSFIFLALALTSAAVAHGNSYTYMEETHRTENFNPTGRLSVENINGSITVKTWDRSEILIETKKRAKTDEELEMIEMIYDLSSDRAHIEVKLPKRRSSFWWFKTSSIRANVSLTITVPTTATLQDIETVNGAVRIIGSQGSVHASTVNGSIKAIDLSANTSLRTVNGAVRVSYTSLPADAELAVKTVNGSITISLPTDSGAFFSGTVVNGRINSDIPLTIKGSFGRKHIKGTIGDGGADLNAKTVNGSIRIVSNSD